MRIASFDVGMNHMAYAVLKKNKKDCKISIKKLDLFSIFKENEKVKCCGFAANGSQCAFFSTWCGNDEPNIIGKKNNVNGVDHTPCDDGDYYYCKKHAPETATCIERVNTKKADYSKICTYVAAALKKINLKKCDKIVIEYQAKMASKKMQFVSHILFYELCKEYLNNPDAKCKIVKFADRDKYKSYDGPEIDTKTKVPAGAKGKRKQNAQYRIRKERGIEIARYFMNKFGETKYLEEFESGSFDKQDDMADAYIQGVTLLLGTAKSVKKTKK